MRVTWRFLFVLHGLLAILNSINAARMRDRNRSSGVSCPVPMMKHGKVRMQKSGRWGIFSCEDSFEIQGPMRIDCQTGRWKQDIPICIKSGCAKPKQRSNGTVQMDEKKSTAMLFCSEGYFAAGNTLAYCDGENWDRDLGECREDLGHTKNCDFETISLCGYTHGNNNDFAWKRRNGWISYEKVEFGPKHDHTIGKPLVGFNMVPEATTARKTQKSRFLSPIHSHRDSEEACFRFYYHMYGASVGRLRVILNSDLDEIADNRQFIIFDTEGSQGNMWHLGYSDLEPIDEDFQIVFEATGNNGIISDIAIDDVALLKETDCLDYSKPQTTTEDSDGIYDMQSCENRCTETQSTRLSGGKTFVRNGRLIEKCDCHIDCDDECCPDYTRLCVENLPTESEMTLTPVVEPSNPENSNARVDETSSNIPNFTPRSTTPTTSTTSTTLTTSTSRTISTPTSIQIRVVTPNITSVTNSTPITAKTPTPTPIPTTITKLTSSTTRKIMPKVTTLTLQPKLTQNVTKSTPATQPKIIPVIVKTIEQNKPSNKTTLKPANTSTTQNIKKIPNTTHKLIAVTTKPTVKMSTTSQKPTSTTRMTNRTTVNTTSNSLEVKSRSVKMKWMKTADATTIPNSYNSSNSTEAGLNAMLMPPQQNTAVQFIPILIILCVLSLITVFGWKRFGANKWNQFNSQQVEYKSNYEATEEPLVRSNSFTIDDSFGESLITDLDDPTEIEYPKDCKPNKKIKKEKPEKTKATTNESKKTKKNSDRYEKKHSEFSEKRCLTADDEEIDFSLQTSE